MSSIFNLISKRIKELKYSTILVVFSLFFLVGGLTLFLSQFIQNESVFSLPPLKIILGLICCVLPILVVYLFTMWPRFSCVLISGLCLFLSTANHYVYEFRGSELCPSDLLSIGTARNVADKYTFSFPGQVVYSWLLFALIVLILFAFPAIFKIEVFKINNKTRSRVVTFVIIVLLGLVFLTESPNITVQHFLNGGSYLNGYLLNFTLEVKEITVHKPEQYSLSRVQQIGQKYGESENDLDNTEKHNPDIIVIMDEAYSDLSVLGSELNTNIPVSPFISSLRENTTYGYTLSSVYGGGTPNSEYEFLTGNSLLFLKGIIYQKYLREPSYSLVSCLKVRGYRCIAMHPYLESGWRRNDVWPNLLFDECHFLDDFPQKNLTRGLVSDQEMFNVLLDTYRSERKNSDKPLFIFGVTMQNHSDYDYDEEDFHNTIELQGYREDYPDVEQYLSLVNETDRAVESFLKELEEIDRETIVLFYGDHQPALNESFLQEVHGGTFDTLDEKQLLQEVPFFIWTTYDSDSHDVGLTSMNYLSNYLLSKANIGLPVYNCFLKDVEKVMPAMNSHGYFSHAENRFLEYSDAEGSEQDWLNKYWILEYNSLIDIKNLDPYVFPLEE